MCGGFPGCVMIRITNPFDQVFLVVISLAVIKDGFNFEFVMVVEGDRIGRRSRKRAMVDRIRGLVWAEDRYVKDWVYLEGVREVEFVGDGGDLLNDLVRTNEPVL